MFAQLRARFPRMITLAVLLTLLASAAVAGARANQTTISPTIVGPNAATATPKPPTCARASFNPSNFPTTPTFSNPFYPLTPGTQWILEGYANSGTTRLEHQVIFTVTDLTKVIDGVRTVVLWDRDFYTGQLTEEELAFHAEDTGGTPWNLGEYPAQYTGGNFTGAPDTWISGLATEPGQFLAQGGTIIPGNPQVPSSPFLQAYAEPGIILDCGQVSMVNQHVCAGPNCYDNVLIINETSPPDPGSQLKYYAPGAGNFRIDPVGADPLGETLILSKTVQLSVADCVAARNAALALEARAYSAADTSQTVYKQTTPMEQTNLCQTLSPTDTPTSTPTETPTATATSTAATSTATPFGTPPSTNVFLPIISKALPTSTPTPTVPPAVFDNCQSDPNPAGAPNYPIKIVNVDKVAEVVTLQNVSNATVSLEDWNMCSINGNQEHDQIFGTIGPGQIRNFPNTGGTLIWSDNERDDGALYSVTGFLISYWVDE